MKTYHLAKSTVFTLLAVLAIFVLAGLTMILIPSLLPSSRGHHPPPALFLALAWGTVILIFTLSHLRVPYAITWMDDNSLEFRGLFLRTRVPVSEITSIKTIPMKMGFIKITHRRGSIRVLNQITGFYELLSRIKDLNPEVEIKGC